MYLVWRISVCVGCRGVLGAVVRTKVRVDEVGGVVEFHHRFWLPAFVCADVVLQAADDEVVVDMLFVVLDVGGVAGRHLWRRFLWSLGWRGG